jgi:ribosomal-protein-alanine N-acetyltransferase
MTPLHAVHAELIAGMHQVCFVKPWNKRAMAELLAMPGSFGWLDDETAPRGFVMARRAADEAEILTLLVLPPFRRLGLGLRLLDQVAAQARSEGAVRLFLEVASSNQSAILLYDKASFRQIGRRAGYYAADTDALLMAKPL